MGRTEAGCAGGSASEPSLDIRGQNCTPPQTPFSPSASGRRWSRQERRAYQRIRSGLEKHKGERLRFITLTTAPGMKRSLQEAFRALVVRIRRKTPLELSEEGYVERKKLHYYYPGKRLTEGLKFDYFRVRVSSEGVSGVIHILYFGDYIPQEWLSNAWEDLTGSAYVVDIRACKRGVGNTRRLSAYCISQYVASQKGEKHFSWSWGWCFRGFVWAWRMFMKYLGPKRALFMWHKLLKDGFLWFGLVKWKPPPNPPDLVFILEDYVRSLTWKVQRRRVHHVRRARRRGFEIVA